MPVVVVANPKGGVGKSTLSTQIAGYYASRGHKVMLGDIDRQQSSDLWLKLRPPQAAPIATWDVDAKHMARPPKGVTHAVLDTPAGLRGHKLASVIQMADQVLIPLQPSVFDIFATRAFIDELRELCKGGRPALGLVGMRVDARTIAADKLHDFEATLDIPVVGTLRDTQNYVHLAAHGLTVFDVSPSRVARDLEQWAPICAWLSP